MLGKASTDDKCHLAIVPLFSEFEPRQKLNQSQMSFGNLVGYILSISMCMQNFITIFHSVQEIAPLSPFQNLELGKASTDKNVILRSLGLDLVNINVYAKVYQNIPLSPRDRAIFTFSEFGARQSFDQCHFAISWTRCHQHQCVCKILSKCSKLPRDINIFHEQAGDKIFTNCPVTKSKALYEAQPSVWVDFLRVVQFSFCLLSSPRSR